MSEVRMCACGEQAAVGQYHCVRCLKQRRRQADLQPRQDVLAKYSLVGEQGKWANEGEMWIELQQCHGKQLTTYLKSRSAKRKVWPDTDHSLVCWMRSERDAQHVCDCGAR